MPILDTLFAIVRRATRRQSFATADKGHLHHRLMNLGHGQRRSVLILWLWTALLSALVLYPVFTTSGSHASLTRCPRAWARVVHGVAPGGPQESGPPQPPTVDSDDESREPQPELSGADGDDVSKHPSDLELPETTR